MSWAILEGETRENYIERMRLQYDATVFPPENVVINTQDQLPLEDPIPVDPKGIIRPKEQLLQEAIHIVCNDRNASYGDPNQDFKRTAELWTTYLRGILERISVSGSTEGFKFEAHDVAIMIALLKISRLCWSPGKRDNWLDLAGYSACGWDTIVGNPTINIT